MRIFQKKINKAPLCIQGFLKENIYDNIISIIYTETFQSRICPEITTVCLYVDNIYINWCIKHNKYLDRIWPFCSQQIKWYTSENRYIQVNLFQVLHMPMQILKKKKKLKKWRWKSKLLTESITGDEKNQCLFICFLSSCRKYKTLHVKNALITK